MSTVLEPHETSTNAGSEENSVFWSVYQNYDAYDEFEPTLAAKNFINYQGTAHDYYRQPLNALLPNKSSKQSNRKTKLQIH